MSFLGFYPFSNWERVVNKNLGVKGKCPKVTYLIFLTGFHWRISLLSRANRLCIAFNAGLRDSGLSCLSLLSLARSEMAVVRLPRDLSKNSFFFVFFFRWGEGNPTSVWGLPPPIIWLHFLFPLPMSGDPRSLKCKHLCDPQSFLTVTFWLLDNVSSTGGGYHSHLLVSVSHHVTLLIKTKSGLSTGIGWCICISKSLRIFCVSFSRTDSGCVYIICQHDQILISCTIPNESFFPPCDV